MYKKILLGLALAGITINTIIMTKKAGDIVKICKEIIKDGEEEAAAIYFKGYLEGILENHNPKIRKDTKIQYKHHDYD